MSLGLRAQFMDTDKESLNSLSVSETASGSVPISRAQTISNTILGVPYYNYSIIDPPNCVLCHLTRQDVQSASTPKPRSNY